MPVYEVPVWETRRGLAVVEAEDVKGAMYKVWSGEAEIDWIDGDWSISEYDVVEAE